MTKQNNKSSETTCLQRKSDLLNLASIYALRCVLIFLAGTALPGESEYADSLLLGTLTFVYAYIELISAAFLYLKADQTNTPTMIMTIALWASASWLAMIMLEIITTADSYLMQYGHAVSYTLEAVMIAAIIMEIDACLRQRQRLRASQS